MPVLTKINTNSIAEDAITGDKFAGDAYLSNTANQNISGTYSENRLYTSDAYTLSGNATINSHLTLSSVKPTADVVLTAGGAYTITGTGVLSAGSLLAKERTDLTGMTGEVGSVVTGSPNLNLGNATFPAGHVIQTRKVIIPTGDSNTDYYSQLLTTTPTTLNLNGAYEVYSFTATDGNTLILTTGGIWYTTPHSTTDRGEIIFYKDSTKIGSTSIYNQTNNRLPIHFSVVRDNISGYSNVTISIKVSRSGTSNTLFFGNNGEYTNTEGMYGFILIQEIQA